jgi:type IV fimbrial biogenesis protein FimT
MSAPNPKHKGFTLIELMVTLTVIVILLLVAVPSFQAYRQRATVRAISQQAQGLWQQARMEAAKRDTWIRYGVGGSGTCIGIGTQGLVGGATPTASNASACDCTPGATSNQCDITTFVNTDWRGVTISGTPTLGGSNGFAIIEPKNATLTATADAGAITFQGPPGPYTYRINLRVDAMGRGNLCQSSTSATLSDFANRVCSP